MSSDSDLSDLSGSNIYGSNLLNDLFVTTLTTDRIISGDINITDDTISGLDNPVNEHDSATKDYVNNILRINKDTSIINNNNNVTYTGDEVVSGFIQRYVYSSVNDIFPNATSIISSLQDIDINNVRLIIQNMSTLSDNFTITININQSGLNFISEPLSNEIIINPFSLIILNLIIVDSETINMYINKTFVQNLSQQLYFNQNSLLINNTIRTTNVVSIKTNVFSLSVNTTYTANQIINSIITRTVVGLTDYFPTNTDILTELNTTQLDNTWTFKTVIRNKTGSPLTILSNTGMVFQFSAPFILGVENAVTFLTRSTGTGLFNVYLLQINTFDSLCSVM